MNIYIGIDISKPQLDVDMDNKIIPFTNNNNGINKLVSDLKNMRNTKTLNCVVVEATGGYEKYLVDACQDNDIPIHVAHANKVRAFAKSKGILAKTDKLDARVLSEYGALMNIKPDERLRSINAGKIKGLLSRREQLMNDRQRDKNRIDKINDPDILSSIANHISWLDKETGKR